LHIDLVPGILLASCVIAALVLVRVSRSPVFLWAAGCLMMALGLFLLTMGARLPAPISILCANFALIVSFALYSAGAAKHAGRRMALDIGAGVCFAVAFAVAYLTEIGIGARIIVISAGMLVFGSRMAFLFAKAGPHRGNRVAAGVTALIALLGLVRLLDTLDGHAMEIRNVDLQTFTLYAGVVVTSLTAVMLAAITYGARKQAASSANTANAAEVRSWALDPRRGMLITPTGGELRLTAAERIALQTLARTGQSVSRTELIAAIGRDADNPKDRSIDVLISRLRRKSSDAGAPLPITSIRGHGYMFSGELREV
jgi:hypothetical protein